VRSVKKKKRKERKMGRGTRRRERKIEGEKECNERQGKCRGGEER